MDHPQAAQMTYRQPRWQEVTSGQMQQQQEEQKEGTHVAWHLTHLEEMKVPAFSYTPND